MDNTIAQQSISKDIASLRSAGGPRDAANSGGEGRFDELLGAALPSQGGNRLPQEQRDRPENAVSDSRAATNVATETDKTTDKTGELAAGRSKGQTIITEDDLHQNKVGVDKMSDAATERMSHLADKSSQSSVPAGMLDMIEMARKSELATKTDQSDV